MTTFSLSMVVNWDNCHKPSLRKIFITRKKVGLIEYFHSCYTSPMMHHAITVRQTSYIVPCLTDENFNAEN